MYFVDAIMKEKKKYKTMKNMRFKMAARTASNIFSFYHISCMNFDSLNDEELKKCLVQYNIPICPITNSTKKTLIMKLKNMFSQSHGINNKPDLPYATTNSEKNESQSNQNNESKSEDNDLDSSFYGIAKPANDATPNIVRSLKDAVSVAKSSPGARFKAFKTFEEAESFSKSPFESSLMDSSLVNAECSDPTTLFPSIKAAEFQKFKRLIELGDLSKLKQLINSNPKYLIASSDRPSIIHEGFHRNSFHYAAFLNKPDILVYIILKLKDFNWLQFYFKFQGDIKYNLNNISDRLLDLYLNTPDKAQENALHIASKYGYIEIIEMLLKEPSLDRSLINGFHETAEQMICSRCSSHNLQQLSNNISSLFKNAYFVTLSREHLVTYTINPNVMKIASSNNIISVIGPMPCNTASTIYKIWSNDSPGLANIIKGRSLAKEYKCHYKERFSFLGSLVDIYCEEGFHLLEEYLKRRNNTLVKSRLTEYLYHYDDICLNLCEEYEKPGVNIRELSSEMETLDLKDKILFEDFQKCYKDNDLNVKDQMYEDTSNETEDLNDVLSLLKDVVIPKDMFPTLWKAVTNHRQDDLF